MGMNLTQDTVRRVQAALASQGILSRGDMGLALQELQKATFAAPSTTTTGLNYYNLEPVAKRLYNAYTPFRNKTPRTKGMGSAANWRSLSAINASKIPMGVPDGFRGAELGHTVKEFTAKYVKIGSESATTFLAQ